MSLPCAHYQCQVLGQITCSTAKYRSRALSAANQVLGRGGIAPKCREEIYLDLPLLSHNLNLK